MVTVVPATLVSIWALINQRRQTTPNLRVVISPLFSTGVNGESVLADDWYGVVVRNLSPFPLRICNIGYHIGKKYYSFGKPVINPGKSENSTWPYEIAARARASFYLDYSGQEAKVFTNAVLLESKAQEKLLWEISRAYAMTECNMTFISPRIARKTLQMLRRVARGRQNGSSRPPL